VVYTGTFDQNKYEGVGTQNYDNGVMHYRGTFHENLYEGSGTLFRQDGTRAYVGDFSRGLMSGDGTLYDTGDNEIYSGAFAGGSIVYSELLGKTVSQVSECYKGHRDLYTTSSESVAYMDGINALYHAQSDTEALDDEETVDAVYVLSDVYTFGGDALDTISELEEVFGDPYYEGNSNVILPEAVAINTLKSQKTTFLDKVDMDVNREFSDVAEINSFDRDYVVYIYSFRRGDIMYSFVCKEKSDYFEFYYLTGAGDESA
jgi:hypothetical protein